MAEYIVIDGAQYPVRQVPPGKGRKGKNKPGTHHGDRVVKTEKVKPGSSLKDPLATALQDSKFEW